MAELDPDAIRRAWIGANASPARAKANRRKVEKAASKAGEYWTGRSAQLNIRMTEDFKAEVQDAVAEFGMSMADAFETAMIEFMTKRRAKP